MAHTLESFDESFYDSAPMRYEIDVTLPASPETVWAEFTRQNTLDWCRALRSVQYTSPEPHHVGTTRSVRLAPGFIAMDEEFFIWEEDSAASVYRHGFRAVRVNLPGLRRFGEYTEVTPAEHGSRLIWKFAMELGGLGLPSALSNRVAAVAFGTVESDTVRYFTTR